jgi:hypothetical protein
MTEEVRGGVIARSPATKQSRDPALDCFAALATTWAALATTGTALAMTGATLATTWAEEVRGGDVIARS